MVHNEIILKTMDDQKIPNVKITTKKYNIIYLILQHYFNNKIIFHNKNYFKSTMLFTNFQKLISIEQINEFLIYNLHTIFQVFENLVVEIVNDFIKK